LELKERLRNALKTKYGLETDGEIMKAIESMPGIDLGIFVTPLENAKENIA
jgi:hypothetical protein